MIGLLSDARGRNGWCSPQLGLPHIPQITKWGTPLRHTVDRPDSASCQRCSEYDAQRPPSPSMARCFGAAVLLIRQAKIFDLATQAYISESPIAYHLFRNQGPVQFLVTQPCRYGSLILSSTCYSHPSRLGVVFIFFSLCRRGRSGIHNEELSDRYRRIPG